MVFLNTWRFLENVRAPDNSWHGVFSPNLFLVGAFHQILNVEGVFHPQIFDDGGDF